MSILLKAISIAKSGERKAIRDAIESIRNHKAITGTLSYDRGEGTPRKDVNIVKSKADIPKTKELELTRINHVSKEEIINLDSDHADFNELELYINKLYNSEKKNE